MVNFTTGKQIYRFSKTKGKKCKYSPQNTQTRAPLHSPPINLLEMKPYKIRISANLNRKRCTLSVPRPTSHWEAFVTKDPHFQQHWHIIVALVMSKGLWRSLQWKLSSAIHDFSDLFNSICSSFIRITEFSTWWLIIMRSGSQGVCVCESELAKGCIMGERNPSLPFGYKTIHS